MARDYCSLDAQRCFAIGYLVCENIVTSLACSCSQTASSKLCALDHLVMPVLLVLRVYENGVDTGEFRSLADLRNFCPRAFKNSLDKWGNDETLYQHFQNKLFRSQGQTVWYDFTNSELRDELMYLSNAIFFSLFGITDEVESRGFLTLSEYLQHANCTAHIAQRLHLNDQMFAQAQATKDNHLQYYSQDIFDGVTRELGFLTSQPAQPNYALPSAFRQWLSSAPTPPPEASSAFRLPPRFYLEDSQLRILETLLRSKAPPAHLSHTGSFFFSKP